MSTSSLFLESPRFPGCPSFGFTSDAEYSVAVIEQASGVESRNRNWSRPLHHYTASLLRAEADVQDVLEFYHAVGGRAYGFRFKDYADYKSCKVHETVSATDQPLILDTTQSPDAWQLVKDYNAGDRSQRRELYKPVAGTVLIADNGTPKTEGVDYTVDYTTGLVALSFTPSGTMTWGGEFDVPCRFDSGFPLELVNQRVQGASFTLRELRRANAV